MAKRSVFPIVGIGASAGGMEAIIQLLGQIPADPGMAFVLIQHLDPAHRSLSADIYSRSTTLKVHEITEGMRVEPNNVYVLPPNYKMRIEEGILKLQPRTKVTGKNTTIDFFFKSLALSQKTEAIGVVLSGTGADGTLGLGAIKARGGLTCAQEVSSAKYQEMPRSAVTAGVVDLILRPDELVPEIARVMNRPSVHLRKSKGHQSEELGAGPEPVQALHKIFNLLRVHTNIDFSNYKHATIDRRIRRRMMVRRSGTLEAYAEFLESNPEEIKTLYNELLINVTEFFRDPDSLRALAAHSFPQFIRDSAAQTPIRIWVPGCATGEEVYSIAMTLFEFLEAAGLKRTIQIFATDISESCIQTARAGEYPETISKNVSRERLKHFFEKIEGGYKVRKAVRDICLFSIHDMTKDPPFAQLDLISCRNVLIYFAPLLQKRVLPIFHYGLKPNGFLWLGLSETPGEFTGLFSLVDKSHKIYSKISVRMPMRFQFQPNRLQPNVPRSPKELVPLSNSIVDFQKEADKLILSRFTPPTALVNAELEVLQFRGRIVPFLEPSLSNNLIKMARPELLAPLRALLQSVKKENKSVRRNGLKFEVDEVTVIVDIQVLPVDPSAMPKDRIYLIVFQESVPLVVSSALKKLKLTKAQASKKQDPRDLRIRELLSELSETRESQQSFVDQYELTQGDLTAANEELQSGNEELQSTNEEMETAKEELQSTNEELVMVNEELQVRNSDLISLGSDLKNLLASTEIPILMVGNDKCIRRFTPEAETTFNLIPSDVGRPIGNIKSDFDLDLEALISEVTENLRPKEIEVQDRKGAWRRVQIRPYQTIDNKIDGAIIAVVDIDKLKKKEERADAAFEYVTSVAEAVPLPLAVVDHDLNLKSANHSFYEYFQLAGEAVEKDLFTTLETEKRSLDSLRELFFQSIGANTSFTDFEINSVFPKIGPRKMLVSGGKVRVKGGDSPAILLSFVDITERRRIEAERNLLLTQEQDARGEAEKANRAKDVFLATLSHELRTPLSSILTWAQLIKLGKIDAEKTKHGASVIEQSAKTQSQLIDDLLDVSRIVAGKLTLEIKEVSPAVVVASAVDSVRSMVEKKSLTVDTQISAEVGLILADPSRLQQIVCNLLTNAIKFSPKKGRIEVRMEFIGDGSQHFVQITVRDHGKGIPPDFLPHIFDRFSQADSASTRVHGGLGLGLSIVHNLVELQGGTVRAENVRAGQGAIFTVTFPMTSLSAGIMQTEPFGVEELMRSLRSETQEQPRLDGLKILVVDDNESAREAISIYLKSFGGEILSVDSAKEAFESLPRFKPDLLVSDIAMPLEDGYSLISRIRALGAEDGGLTPAVALTAYATTEDSKRAMAAGFHAHLAKPVEAHELARVILRLVGPKVSAKK